MEVIILAGGLGTRLRSAIQDIPKCMAPLSGAGNERPFLAYLLDWLMLYPIEHVVFSVGHLKEQVIAYVQGREWPFAYDFAQEDSPLGTGGGIRLALSFCRSKQVFVINGDTFFPADLNAMPFEMPVTLALKPMKDFERYGTVTVQQASAGLPASENYFSGQCKKNHFSEAIANLAHADALLVTAFHEKAPCAMGLINGGVYAIRRDLLDLSPLPERFSFEKEVLEPGAACGQIGGWVSDAFFIDIGIPEDYSRAQWAVPAWKAVQKASRAVLATSAHTLFLDRDGVLNRHLPGEYVKSWAQWEWMPGVLEELPKWAGQFEHIVLVTNQRGVGKGLMSDEDLSRIHARMVTEILDAGGRIDLLLSCTAVSEADPRRKPGIGMFTEAAALLPGIDAKSSVMIGDSASDAAFAKNCGMQFILLSPEAAS